MIDEREIVRIAVERLAPPEPSYERLVRRRDRKRRNQRIAAGVVGIMVFAAAIWIVWDAASLDRSETSVGPAGDITGPAVPEPTGAGPAQTAPPSLAIASGEPDVVRQTRCSHYSKSRLELTKAGPITVVGGHPISEAIRVRYEVHRSPVGHQWRIAIRHGTGNLLGLPIFRGIRKASDSGRLAVEVRVRWPQAFHPSFTATAIDTQTGQACMVDAGL